jgi:hypothetical protein
MPVGYGGYEGEKKGKTLEDIAKARRVGRARARTRKFDSYNYCPYLNILSTALLVP